MDANHWQETLGRIPRGLFILTCRHEQAETGMLASWVMQAGFTPPMVTVALQPGRPVAQWIEQGAPFALNLVPAGDKALLKHFGKGFAPHEDAFAGLEAILRERGMIVLPQALGYLACEPRGALNAGDHRIILAEVVGGTSAGEGAPYVHIRKTGARY